jgi:hypothetical protein
MGYDSNGGVKVSPVISTAYDDGDGEMVSIALRTLPMQEFIA